MGSTKSKEEVIIAQNAAGSNSASVDQLTFHLNAMNIILTVLLLIVSLAFVYCIYRVYRRCHKKWMNNEINRRDLRLSSWRRARRPEKINDEI